MAEGALVLVPDSVCDVIVKVQPSSMGVELSETSQQKWSIILQCQSVLRPEGGWK